MLKIGPLDKRLEMHRLFFSWSRDKQWYKEGIHTENSSSFSHRHGVNDSPQELPDLPTDILQIQQEGVVSE